MRSDAANAPQSAGMALIKEHVPGLYGLRSIAYIVVCFLVPLVPAYLINWIGWWMPLISAAAWNGLAFYLMSRISWNAESIRERYLARYGDRAYEPFFYRYVVPVFSPCTIPFLMILAVGNSPFVPPLYPCDALIPHIHMGERHDAGAELLAGLVPDPPARGHHRRPHGTGGGGGVHQGRLLKTGLLVALGIGVHNFPEGITSFAGTMRDPALGIAIAIAIALHNIPEGIAVSTPVYAATGSRAKALWWSALSGLAEPVGTVLAAAILLPVLNATVLGLALAAVAGIMVFISLDELIPVASSFSEEHLSTVGVMAGMAVMALSLGLLR